MSCYLMLFPLLDPSATLIYHLR